MATYTVRTWQIDAVLCTHVASRKRIDAAVNEMYRQAYAVLAAFGKLDTAAAYNVMAAVSACEDIIPAGEQRNVVISNTGYSVTLSNGGI